MVKDEKFQEEMKVAIQEAAKKAGEEYLKQRAELKRRSAERLKAETMIQESSSFLPEETENSK